MSDPWAMFLIVGCVLLGTCLVLGFLAGIACWQERDARRLRREARDRMPLPDERRHDSGRSL